MREERWRLACGVPAAPRGLVLGEYLDQWLEVVQTRVRPRTLEAYQLCARRVQGRLGMVPLKKLTPHLIQRLYGDLLSSNLSPRSVMHTQAVLHRALKQAHHWGLITQLPTQLVAVPRSAQREMTALTARQLSVLLATSRGTRWYPLWVLLGTAGLRIGEALGLGWSDVNLVIGRIQIRRALQRQRGRGLVFVEPKSAPTAT